MTSFYYAPTLTRGNWFRTNQPEYDSDDQAGDTVTSRCVLPMRNIWHFTGSNRPMFVTLVWCSKTQNYRRDRDIGCQSLVRCDFQNLPTILA